MSNTKNIVEEKFSSIFNLILISLIAVTLYINTGFYDPFNFPKFTVLLISSTVLLSYLFTYRKYLFAQIMFEDVLFFSTVFFLTLSLLFTNNIYIGIFGENLRKNGYLSFLFFLIIWISTIKIFKVKYIKQLRFAINFIAIFLLIYGLLQQFNLDPIPWKNPYNRILLTVGNPNFASATLAIVVLLLTMLMFVSEKKLAKVFYVLIILGLINLIIATESRQGLIASGIGVMCFISLLIWKDHKKRGTIAIILTLIFVFSAILGIFKIGPLKVIMYKESIGVRIFYWKAGLKMFLANPVFGVGIDSYGYFFKSFRESGYPLKYGFNISSNNAHNSIIQIFATCGLFVGILVLFLSIFTAYSAFKLLKVLKNKEQIILIGLFSSWIAFFSQSLISIDNLGIVIWGWILSGLIIGTYRSSIVKNERQTQGFGLSKSIKFRKQPILPLAMGLCSVVVVLLLSVPEKNMYNFMQNRISAEVMLSQKFKDPYYDYLIAVRLVDSKNYGLAKKILYSNIKTNPRSQDSLETLAYILEQENNPKAAIEIREKIDFLDPFNMPNLVKLGILYKQNNQINLTHLLKTRIIDFDPNSEFSKYAVTNF